MMFPEWLMDLVVAAHARAAADPNENNVAKKLTVFLHHHGTDADLFDGKLGECSTDLEVIKMACNVIGTGFVQRGEETTPYRYLFINPRPSLAMIAARTSFENSPLDTVLCQADGYLEFEHDALVSY